MDATILAQVGVYVSPSYDNISARKKQRSWNKFMNSLDWNKISKKQEKPKAETLKAVFGGLGVPLKKKEVKT